MAERVYLGDDHHHILLWMRKWSLNTTDTNAPWMYKSCRRHLWDVFCIHWIVVSWCAVVGRE